MHCARESGSAMNDWTDWKFRRETVLEKTTRLSKSAAGSFQDVTHGTL
jgi:hypothetical protein